MSHIHLHIPVFVFFFSVNQRKLLTFKHLLILVLRKTFSLETPAFLQKMYQTNTENILKRCRGHSITNNEDREPIEFFGKKNDQNRTNI